MSHGTFEKAESLSEVLFVDAVGVVGAGVFWGVAIVPGEGPTIFPAGIHCGVAVGLQYPCSPQSESNWQLPAKQWPPTKVIARSHTGRPGNTHCPVGTHRTYSLAPGRTTTLLLRSGLARGKTWVWCARKCRAK